MLKNICQGGKVNEKIISITYHFSNFIIRIGWTASERHVRQMDNDIFVCDLFGCQYNEYGYCIYEVSKIKIQCARSCNNIEFEEE